MDYVRYLFNFKGRINRARYLAVQVALLTIWFLFIDGAAESWPAAGLAC
jgi:uncharacterized membrane protein YhaH (DUF805 family)